MTKQELEAYRAKQAALFARASEAQSKIIALNESAQGLMVRVGKGDRVIVRPDVKEKGWRGIPSDIPQNMYPHRQRRSVRG